MIVAGIDIGSTSAKAVIMDGDTIVAKAIMGCGPDSAETAWKVMKQTLAAATCELTLEDIDHITSSGYGRLSVPFSNSKVTEISSHARGNQWFCAEVRTVLDMGGQDCKAIRCDSQGKVTNFVMNDKCAAGTGRYLERVSATLGMELDEIGFKSLEIVESAATINSYCVVFAQQDIILLLREGKHPNDILAGACDAIASRIEAMLQRIGVEQVFAISGGVAKNLGVVKRLEQRLGVSAHIALEPDMVGAIGAALFARARADKLASIS